MRYIAVPASLAQTQALLAADYIVRITLAAPFLRNDGAQPSDSERATSDASELRMKPASMFAMDDCASGDGTRPEVVDPNCPMSLQQAEPLHTPGTNGSLACS